MLSLFTGGLLHVLWVVPLGMLHAALAFRRRDAARTAVLAGATVISVVGHFVTLIRFHIHHVWVPAVGVSIAFLVAASALERHHDGIRRALLRLHGHFTPKA